MALSAPQDYPTKAPALVDAGERKLPTCDQGCAQSDGHVRAISPALPPSPQQPESRPATLRSDVEDLKKRPRPRPASSHRRLDSLPGRMVATAPPLKVLQARQPWRQAIPRPENSPPLQAPIPAR